MNSTPEVPNSIGRYELGPEIGRGNMAAVYRAYDPRLQRELAIKLLRPRFARDDGYRRDFLTEAHAAGRLSHSGIVTIHDVGESDGTPFIAMELLEGRTLQQRVDGKGPLSAAEVVDIALQLARALDYAHNKGVVHRDVKADNVVLAGDGSQPKLTDFGIARLRLPESGTEATEETVVGTPDYMAPEQVSGRSADGRADLYALGVLLYFLLSGRLPFSSDTTLGTLDGIMHDPAPALRPRDTRTPSALVELIHTLMAKAPADRYQSGAELAEELVQIQREMELANRSRWRLPLSVRWPAAMGLVVAVTLVAGSAIVYHQQRAAMTQLVFDYGASMVDTIAADAAEDLLLGDDVAVQAMVLDIQRNRQMAYLRIVDREGTVIASSEPDEVGTAQGELLAGETLVERDGLGRVARYSDDGAERFLFQAPVVYRDQHVGELALGISSEPLTNALRVSLLAMASLLVATVLTVLAGTWVLSWRLRLPLRMLGRGLDKVANGELDHRIRIRRRDELGELFVRYNMMAESLQARQGRRKRDRPDKDRSGRKARRASDRAGGGTRRLNVAGGSSRRR